MNYDEQVDAALAATATVCREALDQRLVLLHAGWPATSALARDLDDIAERMAATHNLLREVPRDAPATE